MRPGRRALEVLASGPLTLVQDLGRRGFASIGVSPSGAADRRAFRLGARLLAQSYDAAALEITFGGLQVRAVGDLTLVITGAPAPAWRDGLKIGPYAPFVLRDGETLRFAVPSAGLRTYLSVRGGVQVAAVLGSRSTDTLSRLGPAPLRAGDLLPVGPAPAAFPNVDVAPVEPPTASPLRLAALPGPRSEWIADLPELEHTAWLVSSRSDRIGIRLEGGALRRRAAYEGQELLSEGVVRGAIQIPPSGEPVIFLADHPVTGGYPVVAVLGEDSADRLAQAVPGQTVRIRLGS